MFLLMDNEDSLGVRLERTICHVSAHNIMFSEATIDCLQSPVKKSC